MIAIPNAAFCIDLSIGLSPRLAGHRDGNGEQDSASLRQIKRQLLLQDLMRRPLARTAMLASGLNAAA